MRVQMCGLGAMCVCACVSVQCCILWLTASLMYVCVCAYVRGGACEYDFHMVYYRRASVVHGIQYKYQCIYKYTYIYNISIVYAYLYIHVHTVVFRMIEITPQGLVGFFFLSFFRCTNPSSSLNLRFTTPKIAWSPKIIFDGIELQSGSLLSVDRLSLQHLVCRCIVFHRSLLLRNPQKTQSLIR